MPALRQSGRTCTSLGQEEGLDALQLDLMDPGGHKEARSDLIREMRRATPLSLPAPIMQQLESNLRSKDGLVARLPRDVLELHHLQKGHARTSDLWRLTHEAREEAKRQKEEAAKKRQSLLEAEAAATEATARAEKAEQAAQGAAPSQASASTRSGSARGPAKAKAEAKAKATAGAKAKGKAKPEAAAEPESKKRRL